MSAKATSSMEKALMIPEIITRIGTFLPLFSRNYHTHPLHGVDFWDPKHLLRAAFVCHLWRSALLPVLWYTYDYTTMHEVVPMIVLKLNIKYVRSLSLLDMKHKRHRELWDALAQHEHIDRLEAHESVFPVKRILGTMYHTLTHLKLSGNCTRMHPFLLIFIERQTRLKSLELTRFNLTASDWKRIISHKPCLQTLVISKQCMFIDHLDKEEAIERAKAALLKYGILIEPGSASTLIADLINNFTTTMAHNQAPEFKKEHASETDLQTELNAQSERIKRVQLVARKLPNEFDFGTLSISKLVMTDIRLSYPFQKSILEASPYLQELEICYTYNSDGTAVASLIRQNCSHLKQLILRSTHQRWTLTMIEGMPQSVQELILFVKQFDLTIAAAIKDRKETLKKFSIDFGQGIRGPGRLESIMSVLPELKQLRVFTYHNHCDSDSFMDVMFNQRWDLPYLHTVHLHGIKIRYSYGGLPQALPPPEWILYYEGPKCTSCSYRKIEDIEGRKLSPLFDVALMEHLKDLPQLSEIVVTETVYRKRVYSEEDLDSSSKKKHRKNS